MNRVILIVMDGCGAGEAPDAELFNDRDHPSTIKHVWEACGGLDAPILGKLGYFAACGIDSQPGIDGFHIEYGRLREMSMGKDSVTGHWELMGVHTVVAFPTYPEGFPTQLVQAFEQRIGRTVLGNKAASGTKIIDQLGAQHMATGSPILYTSADSVFQVACHEETIPIEELYEMCRIGRELCSGANNVQRVIARPFIGDPSSGFKRTERRRDFPLIAPPNDVDAIGDVFGIGVIPELFGGRGFRNVRRTQNNAEHAVMLRDAMDSDARFIFANFEDFDMLYGHRNDPLGFGKAIEQFDDMVSTLLKQLRADDLLILTADHGNDPTSSSTDHSREYVPFVCVKPGVGTDWLGDTNGMWQVGERVKAWLHETGTSDPQQVKLPV